MKETPTTRCVVCGLTVQNPTRTRKYCDTCGPWVNEIWRSGHFASGMPFKERCVGECGEELYRAVYEAVLKNGGLTPKEVKRLPVNKLSAFPDGKILDSVRLLEEQLDAYKAEAHRRGL